ncbi:hypothetical protein, partial [Klebsiella pneumoniae]|uniref:hypothetical protein n=1 Tax=Klebsiella pneumoniae TaxID=573 RepID=UPI003EE03CD8
MEKYESLYVKLFHLFEKCGGAVAFVCGREVSSIFEVATSGFAAEESPDFKASYYKIGRVNDKFDLYVDNGMTSTACVVGKKGV